MNVLIRAAKRSDCAQLVRLAAALNAAEGNPTDLFTQSFAEEACFGPDAALGALVAEVTIRDAPPAIAGMALYHASVNTGFGQVGVYLNDLYVDAEYRRLGIGRALMAYLAAVTKRDGRSFIWWTVKPKNACGLAFYQSLGAGRESVLAHAVGFSNFEVLAAEADLNPATGR